MYSYVITLCLYSVFCVMDPADMLIWFLAELRDKTINKLSKLLLFSYVSTYMITTYTHVLSQTIYIDFTTLCSCPTFCSLTWLPLATGALPLICQNSACVALSIVGQEHSPTTDSRIARNPEWPQVTSTLHSAFLKPSATEFKLVKDVDMEYSILCSHLSNCLSLKPSERNIFTRSPTSGGFGDFV
jgi:hypothetical protein